MGSGALIPGAGMNNGEKAEAKTKSSKKSMLYFLKVVNPIKRYLNKNPYGFEDVRDNISTKSCNSFHLGLMDNFGA